MKGAIFDLDGTLFDSRKTIRRCLNRMLAEYGKEPFGDDVKSLIGKHLLEILAMRGLGAEAAERYREIQMDTYMQDMTVFDGVTDMLDKMQESGWKLAVATMRQGRITREVLKGMGMQGYFDAVVGCDDCQKPKPDPDHVLTACRLLELAPSECVMVGDTIFDIQSGKEAGCHTVAVTWGSGGNQDLDTADAVLDSVEGLRDYLIALGE